MKINSSNITCANKLNNNTSSPTKEVPLSINKMKNCSLEGLNALANQNIAFNGNVGKVLKTGLELAEAKKNLPEFLYHLTTPNNYKGMQKSGKIIPSLEGMTGLNGIFTFDLPNFINNWGKIYDNNTPLDRRLLTRIAQAGDGEVVLLKIPTQNMDPALFKVRSQNLIFDMNNNIDSIPNPYFADRIDLMIDNFPENYWHMMKGAPLEKAGNYNDIGHALEYIYDGEIPIDSVKVVGSANLKDFKDVEFFELAQAMMNKLLNK